MQAPGGVEIFSSQIHVRLTSKLQWVISFSKNAFALACGMLGHKESGWAGLA
jgi:hypothetical protein